MSWTAEIFAYCERGRDAAFWAEPLNALSNIAFLVTAALALRAWHAKPASERGGLELALTGLVAIIGIGSFLFHTFATRWAAIADVAPIGIFMLCYLAYALRRFVGLGRVGVLAGIVAFIATLWLSETTRCGDGPCLNGSLGYVPALAALAGIGGWLAVRRHPAGAPILIGAAMFTLSLSLRTIDRQFCPYTVILASRPLGTHFLWHLLNATLLGILLLTAIWYGQPGRREQR